MSAKGFCQKYFNNALKTLHKVRMNSLFETAWSLAKGAQLTLTSLGRYKEGTAFVKHKIKSVDRLLGNTKLQEESFIVYKELFQSLLESLPRIYLIVDWSGAHGAQYHMLRATVVHHGRGISIYNEVHPQSKLGNVKVHKSFLKRLNSLIPSTKEVIIVTDGGFMTPWFNEAIKYGWNYVGRITRKMYFQLDNQDSLISSEELSKRAQNKVKYIGRGRLGKRVANKLYGNIYSYKEKRKKRTDKSKYPNENKKYSKLNKSGWVLVTSLDEIKFPGACIKNIYKKRMQIEQNFRDQKNGRYGLGWRFSTGKQIKRIKILCLIAIIAQFFLWWIGILAERKGMSKFFQTNSTNHRRVLSFEFLAKEIIYNKEAVLLADDFHDAAKDFIYRYEKLILN